MNLEEYFDFLAPNDIRIKGHRIGIDDVLYESIHNGMTLVAPRDSVESLVRHI